MPAKINKYSCTQNNHNTNNLWKMNSYIQNLSQFLCKFRLSQMSRTVKKKDELHCKIPKVLMYYFIDRYTISTKTTKLKGVSGL